MSVNEHPKVSVVTITYNHEAFISQALDSILSQQTDFAVEVVVADDASTDSTSDIVRDYAARHPDRVVPLVRPANLGIHANFVDALCASRGEYVALCEGDDYWTDPLKLQKQADLLDAKPEVSLCAHPVVRMWEDGEEPDVVWPDEQERADLRYEALLRGNFVPTNSTLSRRLEDYSTIPDIMPLDWYLHLRHARGSEIAMLDETMGVYRRHAGGAWYGSYDDPDAFWTAQGFEMAAFTEAVLDLVADDPGQLAAVHEWVVWVAKLVSLRARETSPWETAKVLGANPRFAAMFARAFADRAADVEWLKEQLGARDQELERLARRLRRARRRIKRLAAPPQRAAEEEGLSAGRLRGRWRS